MYTLTSLVMPERQVVRPRRPTPKITVRPRAVSGYGAYKSTKAGGGGRQYYQKYKAAKAAAKTKTKDNDSGWLSEGLGTVGSMLLPGIGGPLGRGVGSLIKSITGFGDYTVNQNSLIAEAGAPPLVTNIAKDKIFIVRHREYLSDVISSATPGAFKLENYFINPGVKSTFPWLSGVASNFEHYQLRGCLFEFRTMSADALNSTNTALGQVVMATQYNSSLPNFVNKYEMENYEYGQSVKPSESCTHPIECARSESVLGDLYIRPGAVPADDDQRLYDFGNFQIASNGVQGASVNLGELWVTYEVALYKPKLVSAVGDTIPVFAAYANGGTSNAAPFGSVAYNAANTMDVALIGTTLTFPNYVKYGTYFIRIRYSGVATALTYGALVLSPVSGCTVNQAVLVPIGNPATQDSWDYTARIDVTGSGPILNWNVPNTAFPTNAVMTMLITQLPLGFTPATVF